MLPPPCKIKLNWRLKQALGSKSTVLVEGNDPGVPEWAVGMDYHNLYHLEVSRLPRIDMKGHQVSGIHGINTPIFHPTPIVEEYDGLLDEARVAIHEWLTRTSWFNTAKVFFWFLWLLLQGMNPIVVAWRHYRSLHQDEAQSL